MKRLMQIKNLTVDIETLRLLEDISLSLYEHDRLIVVGPNGAGKSTLIQALAQSISYKGQVLIDDLNLATIPSLERAKLVGVFAQNNEVNYNFTVEEIVELGRYSYAPGIFAAKDTSSKKMVDDALTMTGLDKKREQSVMTLSGGELQRVFLAQVFAQDPKILLLDEPTNHLDIQYQKQLYTIIKKWADQKEKAVIAVFHDLSLARLYGNKILLLEQGKLIACGDEKEVLTKENLAQVYQMDVYHWMQGLHRQWL